MARSTSNKTKVVNADLTNEEFLKLSLKVKNEIKDSIVLESVDQVVDTFNEEVKPVITEQITDEVEKKLNNKIKLIEKKEIKRRTFKIIRLYICIIILFMLLGYLLFRLYKTDNLNIIDWNSKKEEVPVHVVNKTTSTTKKVKTLKELKEEYSYLVDKVRISSFNKEEIVKLEDPLRLAMAYKNLPNEAIEKDGSITRIQVNALKNSFNNIFGSLVTMPLIDFKVDGLEFVYSNKSNEFIAVAKTTNNKVLINNIIEIKESKDVLTIITDAYALDDKDLFSLEDLKTSIATVENLNNIDFSVLKGATKFTYTFVKENNDFYLESIK